MQGLDRMPGSSGTDVAGIAARFGSIPGGASAAAGLGGLLGGSGTGGNLFDQIVARMR